MEIKNLYRYKREDGGTSVSPIEPNCEYTEMYRIIAGEDKLITKDGINTTTCADVESAEGWYEIDAPDEDNDNPINKEDMEYAKAGRILLGVEE